ncbi:MAG: radical SAM family heme chaperone HemW [Bacteroidota bacterium]
MAGIYIHIPFCRQKCNYCDFYKTLNTLLIPKFLATLKKEAEKRKQYLNNELVETIYFGGGTPSVLGEQKLYNLLAFLDKQWKIDSNAEITLEANPDDLTATYLNGIRQAGINRLSIGIQSFQDKLLERMNRRHNSEQAVQAVENAAKAGFQNISVDLIYGLPELTETEWQDNLDHVFQLPVHHLSAYHLTYHKGTPFYSWLKKGTLKELSETESIRQFNMLIDLAQKNGFEHYEISNFAKNEIYSRHNTSYWTGKKYLGLGPSAHSFDGSSRRWNVLDTEDYIQAFENNTGYFEEEFLTPEDKFNEYILTRIRTQWGISFDYVRQNFGKEKADYLEKQISKYKETKKIIVKNNIITLSREGFFISDEIMSDLMII